MFYVKNLFGLKVDHPEKLAEIRRTLDAVLARGNAAVEFGAGRRIAGAASPSNRYITSF